MSSHTSQNEFSFAVQANQNYYLHIVIGNGQLGSTTFKNFNGKMFSPEIFNVLIGSGYQMKKKSLYAVSVVIDVNPDTDNMIVSYFITDAELESEAELIKLSPIGVVPFSATISSTTTFYTKLKFD